MARSSSARLTFSPAAIWSTRRPRRSKASTTALPAPPGPSGIPEVPADGLPSPPSSPPLAALTSTNQLALTPKTKSVRGRHDRRCRGGATLRIREESVRFFCETLRALFLVEGNRASRDSGLTGVIFDTQQQQQQSDKYNNKVPTGRVASWLEIWDYAGGASFRAFVAEKEEEEDYDEATNMGEGNENTLFVFLDANTQSRHLKHALVALIELAEGPLACAHMVLAVDRFIPASDGAELIKGLQWAGFSLTTLDYWTRGHHVTSSRWLFVGMEI